jgi:hypothetical protein
MRTSKAPPLQEATAQGWATRRAIKSACHWLCTYSYPSLKGGDMKPFWKTVSACIVITGLGLEFALDEERHKHIEHGQYEAQAELTKEPSYSTASMTRFNYYFSNDIARMGERSENMIRLEELIGEKIAVRSKRKFHEEDTGTLNIAVLRGVESGGIWLEHKSLVKTVADGVGVSADRFQKQPVFFFPYSELDFLTVFSAVLDENTF